MADWWQQAYPGGPAVTTTPLPRPLYFPGNPSGRPVSVDGPDVIAYKRAVSRLGRWPWQTFDDTYSRNFAIGQPGGNVADSGVAGCQRQQPELDASGQLGQATYNFLRCARIPAPLPHAGEPAFDANALNLIAEAWEMFAGYEPDGVVREGALGRAQAELGYTEQSGNQTKYGAWYGMDGQPWCAMFTTWCYQLEGSTCFQQGGRYAYVPYLVADAQAHRYGLSLTSSPIPGDLVAYDWDGTDYDHVGMFEDGTSSSWSAVEGNTSPDNQGSQSNGGGVYRRQRSKSGVAKVAFVRVAA